jgi:tetratricopeptide (TPR) repeat protein
MTIWSAEIKELETLYSSVKGSFPELEKELEQLIKTEDANVVMLYSRRCLEVIITDLCESELNRPRKTEPLKGIIDKLNREEKVPSHIITSMQSLNSMSTYGAHPKEFDPRQVRPVLINLVTVIEWYLKYKSIQTEAGEVKETDRATVKYDLEKTVPLAEQRTDNIFRTLWKRGVPQITAGYFIASWIIIRFLDWILARFDVSTRWADVTLIILIAMIPSVLLYIYNRERINRGKLSLIEKITFPSNIVITVVIVLLLSKGTDLQAMTETVTVVNEFGEKEIHKVFKENYVTKLAAYPFNNESGDTSLNWLQYGISGAVEEDLFQFNYILLGPDNATHLQEQIKYAKTNNFPYFLTGSFMITDGNYEITSRIYQTSNGSVIKERDFRGTNFFSLMDSISLQARIDLGISDNILKSVPDLPVGELLTHNLDAFRSAVEGFYSTQLDYPSFMLGVTRAIESDSTFARILLERASHNYWYQISFETACRDINQAMRHRQKLSEYREISTRILYYFIRGENDKAIALAEMQYELQPYNIQLLLSLIDAYQCNFMINKFEKAAQQLNELMPGRPDYQIMLARSYLFTGKLDKGLEVLENLLRVNPENTDVLLQMGEIYLHKNDLEAAEKMFQKAILFSPEDEKYWSRIFDHIGYIRNSPIKKIFLEPFPGNYRMDDAEMTVTVFKHNDRLILKAKNQPPYFRYPVSDTQFIAYDGFHTETFISNNQGKVIKIIHEQRNIPNTFYNKVWKEDSLILKAKELLNNGNKTEALSAFREASEHNPEHYYLADYIQHLKFVQSSEYENIRPVLDTYSGDYNGLKIYKEDEKIYYMNDVGMIYKLLPLSEYQFMLPSRYNRQIQIVKENNIITGFKIIFIDGRELFFNRTD